MRARWLVVLALTGCGHVPARPARDVDERALIALQVEMVRASEARDPKPLERVIADDFVIAFQRAPGATFEYSDKARSIAKWTASEPGVTGLPTTIEAQRAQIDGDTGVVFARVTDRWHDAEGDHAATTWVTDVFARRDGRWQWIASTEALVTAP